MVPISVIELAVLSLAESSLQMQTVLAHGLAFFYVFLHRKIGHPRLVFDSGLLV